VTQTLLRGKTTKHHYLTDPTPPRKTQTTGFIRQESALHQQTLYQYVT
jgi:hypothetical protein